MAAHRAIARELHAAADLPFFEVHVDTPVEECKRRDPKGLYKKAEAGEITNFTGVDGPYDVPESPELRITTADETVDAAVARIVAALTP